MCATIPSSRRPCWVSQLRDYSGRHWSLDRHLASLTTEHALQPFSRRYFEADGLPTYAREWRVAHADADTVGGCTGRMCCRWPYELDPGTRLKLGELASFLRQPVKYFSAAA